MKLDILRKKIDKIDRHVGKLIVQRVVLVKKIGNIKKLNKLSIDDIKREKQIFNRIRRLGLKQGLKRNDLIPIFKEILKLSKKKQHE